MSFKKFLIIFVAILSIGFSCAYAETPVQAQLTIIEKEIWGFDYGNDEDWVRLERIEKQIFGASNPKAQTEKRVEKITKSLGIESVREAKSSLSELYVPEKSEQGVEYPQIDRLEGVILGSVYKNENIYVRLERLEKKVFGAKQEGDLAQRTEALKRHSQVGLADELNPGERNGTRPYDSTPMHDYTQSTNDVKLQIAALENMIFATDYSKESIQSRLQRLENKIFQRNFEDDEPSTRIARIQAAATANKTAKYYDSNKFQKFTATGIQAASFLLMILAFIL